MPDADRLRELVGGWRARADVLGRAMEIRPGRSERASGVAKGQREALRRAADELEAVIED